MEFNYPYIRFMSFLTKAARLLQPGLAAPRLTETYCVAQN